MDLFKKFIELSDNILEILESLDVLTELESYVRIGESEDLIDIAEARDGMMDMLLKYLKEYGEMYSVLVGNDNKEDGGNIGQIECR